MIVLRWVLAFIIPGEAVGGGFQDTAAAAVGDWAGTTVGGGEGIQLRFTCLRLGLSELLLECCTGPPQALPGLLIKLRLQGLMPGPSVEYQLEGHGEAMRGGRRLEVSITLCPD